MLILICRQGNGEQGIVPFRDGTRVYLTLPDGERVGFTFAPVATEIRSVTYYTPAWVADTGVDYTLESSDVLLSRCGDRYCDLQTAAPYNPDSSTESAYTITAPDGTIFKLDATGKVTEQITASGTQLIYSDSGIVNPESGEAVRFANDFNGRLQQITAPDGTAIRYSYDDLGNLTGVRNVLSGEAVRYGYSQGNGEQGTGNSSFALFAIEKEGLNLLSVDAGSTYELGLAIAGDVNGDGAVNGLDSRLVSDAINSNTYSQELDVNRDGVIDGADISLIGSNYGFVTNKAPTISSTTALTYEDLSVEIPLNDLGNDSEGDRIFYQALNPTNGEVRFAPDGETVIFVPTPGYSGTASFELIADDGFARSNPATIEIEVSDAPITSLDFVERNPSLEVGEQKQLQAIALFLPELLPTSDRPSIPLSRYSASHLDTVVRCLPINVAK